MPLIYLDNNATTRPAPEVVEAMMPFLTEHWGNPSSMHAFGGMVKKHLDTAREQVAALIHADPSEIVFTGCGTESDNMAIRGAIEGSTEKLNVVTSRVEHPAVLGPCRRLKDLGAREFEIGVDSEGQLNMDEFDKAIASGPAVVSIMWANNETGVVFPISMLAEKVRNAGGIFHTDAVQAAGKVEIDVRSLPIDMLSISGHKLHAPKGVGALYIRKGTKLKPLLLGGHQEHGRRGGTENVAAIVAFGKACELARERMPEYERVAVLRDRLQNGLLQQCTH